METIEKRLTATRKAELCVLWMKWFVKAYEPPPSKFKDFFDADSINASEPEGFPDVITDILSGEIDQCDPSTRKVAISFTKSMAEDMIRNLALFNPKDNFVRPILGHLKEDKISENEFAQFINWIFKLVGA